MTAPVTLMNPVTHPQPMVNGTGNTNSAAPATISSNDFLALLVTEMKNQDPTAQTDPNQYVNQLVQVNSLEQLIEINQNLSSSRGVSTPTANAVAGGTQGSTAHPPGNMGGATAGGQTAGKGISRPIPVGANPISAFAGNLGISKPNAAAQRIAQALNGRP